MKLVLASKNQHKLVELQKILGDLGIEVVLQSEIGIEHDDYATLIGGGAKGKLWAQITADMLGITLKTTESSDSSFGSAMLAGIAVGVFSDAVDAVKKCVKVKDTIVPNLENTAKYKELFKKYKAVHDALAPIYHGEF